MIFGSILFVPGIDAYSGFIDESIEKVNGVWFDGESQAEKNKLSGNAKALR